MEHPYDYRKCAILYIDDEEKSLKYFTRVFRNKFRIISAANASEGYRLLEQCRDEIALVMVDQRMPGEKGIEFLRRARRLHPKAIRILTTAYSDLDVAIEAVNAGAISKYVTKPWDIPQLEMILQRACEIFTMQRERDLLLKAKLSALQKMMIADRMLSSGILATRLGHHVRNSLVELKTFLDLFPEKLLEEKIDVEQLRESHFWKGSYEQAQAQIGCLTELMTDLGTATEKSDTLVLRKLQLDKAIERSVEKLRDSLSRKRIAVFTHIPAGLPALMVEEQKFQCLFDLLLKDEVIRLPAGSQIFVSARLGSGKKREMEIEIKDDGPRWPEETIISVFDPFSSRVKNQQEFSINFMACYFIVYQRGGAIQVRNRQDQGVIFTVTLPRQPKIVSSAEEEKTFIASISMNDAFWERMLADQN